MTGPTTRARRVNINADVGESFGRYAIGDDAALIPLIGSANIACGVHAGDPCTMAATVRIALEHGTSIGAHPGFDDRWGFGRRQIHMSPRELEKLVAYQIGALQAIAGAEGARVSHVKPHGALNNMAHHDVDYARAIGQAIRSVDPSLIYVANVGSEMHRAAESLGLRVAREAYADRPYGDDGLMLTRSRDDAVIRDPEAAAAHVLGYLEEGALTSVNGRKIPVEVETICIHGDEPTAVPLARAVRSALEAAGYEIVSLPGLIAS